MRQQSKKLFSKRNKGERKSQQNNRKGKRECKKVSKL